MSVIERERVEEVVAPRPVTRTDVLERAAYLLEEEIVKWGQRAYICPDQSRCMWGVIALAWEDMGLPRDKPLSFVATVEEEMRDMDLPGPSWNDRPERTRFEVIARLRSAAERSAQ